jgi:precorrin-2 dehydrogenase / sirohydrochlorin ferrochelatase
MFPILLNMHGRLGVVVGGGPVGRRKARALLDAGAAVRLVCREPQPADFAHANLEWRQADYHPDHLTGAALVFAAATSEANRRVVADARARGVWVNAADRPEDGDFALPAVLRRGEFVVAVATGGAGPAFARAVRDSLEPLFDDAFGDWVALLAELRPEVLAAVPDPAVRRELLARLGQREWIERLRRDGPDAVRAAVRAEVAAARGDPI